MEMWWRNGVSLCGTGGGGGGRENLGVRDLLDGDGFFAFFACAQLIDVEGETETLDLKEGGKLAGVYEGGGGEGMGE